jgi:hypothetical protein
MAGVTWEARSNPVLRADRGERVADIVALERTLGRQHLVEHTAERPDVRSLVRRSPLRLLGLMYAAVPRIIPIPVIIAGVVIVGDA